MPVLIAAVVLVGALGVLNLIFTLGVIRRLREHTELLSSQGGRDPMGVAAGTEIGEFEATTVDGEVVAHDLLLDETLVAFFAPGCEPCEEKLPSFVAQAASLPGRHRVLAVVVGDAEAAGPMVAALRPVARVVVEEDHAGPLVSAFTVRAFPTQLSVAPGGAGKLVVTANRVGVDLPMPAAV